MVHTITLGISQAPHAYHLLHIFISPLRICIEQRTWTLHYPSLFFHLKGYMPVYKFMYKVDGKCFIHRVSRNQKWNGFHCQYVIWRISFNLICSVVELSSFIFLFSICYCPKLSPQLKLILFFTYCGTFSHSLHMASLSWGKSSEFFSELLQHSLPPQILYLYILSFKTGCVIVFRLRETSARGRNDCCRPNGEQTEMFLAQHGN